MNRECLPAQGTATVFTLQAEQRQRGTAAVIRVSNCITSKCRHLRSSAVSACGQLAWHSGHVSRPPTCSRVISTRFFCGKKATFATRHDSSNPNNRRSCSVSSLIPLSLEIPLGPRSKATEIREELLYRGQVRLQDTGKQRRDALTSDVEFTALSRWCRGRLRPVANDCASRETNPASRTYRPRYRDDDRERRTRHSAYPAGCCSDSGCSNDARQSFEVVESMTTPLVRDVAMPIWTTVFVATLEPAGQSPVNDSSDAM